MTKNILKQLLLNCSIKKFIHTFNKTRNIETAQTLIDLEGKVKKDFGWKIESKNKKKRLQHVKRECNAKEKIGTDDDSSSRSDEETAIFI